MELSSAESKPLSDITPSAVDPAVVKRLARIAAQVRRDVVRMVYEAQSGHPGGSLGCADFMTALFFEVMDIRPEAFDMDGVGEDVFILSNGHISPVYYSVLARRGYFPVSELATFRQIDSRLQGHPATKEGLPGVRIATGSLGQGLSVAVGAALSKRLHRDPHLVYCLQGDGELQEGQNWEAYTFAAHHQVDNLIAVIDYNLRQIDGPLPDIMDLGDLRRKLETYGWYVLEMDGHHLAEIVYTLRHAQKLTGRGRPIVIIMHTVMGKGVDFMEGDHQWHGKPPNEAQFRRAMAQLPETLGDY